MTFVEKFALWLTAIITLSLIGYIMLQNQPTEEFVITVERNDKEAVTEMVEEEPEEEVRIISAESPLDINLASPEELDLLPNIGEKRASDIIAFREEQGGFQSIEEIMLVSGIGEGIFEDLKEFITVESIFSEENPNPESEPPNAEDILETEVA